MTPGDFETALRRDGYAEIVTAEMKPSKIRPAHSHDFDVRALVLEGDITLTCEGSERTYRAGDSFTMAAGMAHAERVGPGGVRYIAGRRRR